MTEQTSIEKRLRQRLHQLDELGNEQLNELLQKLEHQKEKLPLEDHPIIDWGIGVIRAKALEKNQLIQKMCQELEAKYRSYPTFIRDSGLQKLDLNNNSDREKMYHLGMNHLDEVLRVSCEKKDDRCLDYANYIKEHLYLFGRERGESSLSKTIIKNYAVHYDGYTPDPKYPIIERYAKKLAQYLREEQTY